MSVSKYKIPINSINKQLDIPIEMKWDFLERDQAIDEYQKPVLDEIIGPAIDFELTRFPHKEYYSNITNSFLTNTNYEFYFFDSGSTLANSSSWYNSYVYAGFSPNEIYSYVNAFTKSFFKLDFYDTQDERTQQIYLSIILPIQQGLTETALINPLIPPVEIKKPKMILDSIGSDKEGFYIYWLRNREFIDISKFFMTAKFFNARLGVFKQMTNTRQDLITPNKFQFNNADYFYYRVDLDYSNKTYEVFSTSTQQRVGDSTSPIIWYEYVNP